MKSNYPSICVFGTYDEKILSSRVILDGLTLIMPAEKLRFVHQEVPRGVLYESSHLTIHAVAKRIYHRLRAVLYILFHTHEAIKSDVILILPFGLFDLIPALFLKLFFKKTIVYVPQNSLYDLVRYASDNKPALKIVAIIVYHIERVLYHIPHVIFFNTEVEAQAHKDMLNVPNVHTEVIPLGADDSIFYPVEIKKKKTTEFIVLFYGEYNIAQGTEIIVQAASLLTNNKHVRFTMIGEGKTKEDTLKLAQSLGNKNITFLSWLAPDELKKHILGADVVLGMFTSLPLVKRVIPNKVYQALACAKCVVTAKSPAAEAWLTHEKQVFFVPMDDPKKLAEAITILQENPTLRMNIEKEGYRKFTKKFNRKAVAETLVQTIETTRRAL